MSQDMRRERAGVRFETIAGASDYIAQLEARLERVERFIEVLESDRYGADMSPMAVVGRLKGCMDGSDDWW